MPTTGRVPALISISNDMSKLDYCTVHLLCVMYTVDYRSTGCQPARGHLNRENDPGKMNISLPPLAPEKFGLAFRLFCLASACSFSTLKLNLMITTTRNRVSPEFIGSRNCVPMAFTVERPLAQGQYRCV